MGVWDCGRQEEKAAKGPCLKYSTGLILTSPLHFSLGIQASSLFNPSWLMGLVRYRPLPLTPIKTLGLSTRLPALKQTAGPLSPSSLSLTLARRWISHPISVLLWERYAWCHCGGQTERRSWTEPVSLLQWNPAQKNRAIKVECQTIPVQQTALRRDLFLLCASLPAGCHCKGKRGQFWTKVLIVSTTNWL